MNTLLEKSKIELPQGFTTRGAELDDADAAVKLFNTWSQAVIHQNELSDPKILRNEWASPGFNPATDICLVFSPEGMLVGYIEAWTTSKPPVHPWLWGRVHPEFGGLGIGTWLLQWAEERACKVLDILPADLRFAPRTGIFQSAVDSKKLVEDRGFVRIRSSYEMRINMEEAPPTPLWADGITLRTADPETDSRAIYQVDRDSFRDHFGYIEEPFEEGFARFKHFLLGEDSDPSLWFLAMDGDEIAGISLCRPSSYDDPDLGWVNILGVRREWRKRGIGLALLQHSFGEFYKRGKRKVGLGVDAQNLTGALKLYERAGMRVHQAFDQYEKTIRSGREISVESLSE
ncbi:MAG: GNAT family N-acetyltransferase [Anaerolineales bacterium]|nr:GNAT family N-acetyltransferase [Anaerolineales bacterium]